MPLRELGHKWIAYIGGGAAAVGPRVAKSQIGGNPTRRMFSTLYAICGSWRA
jgi:hypothetical protein